MGKVIDITEKLNFEESPKIKIKDIEIEVNSDARTVLQIMQLIGDGKDITPKDINSMYELIFNEAERKKIDKIKLQFKDFQSLIMAAINVVTGDEKVGE